MRLAEFSFYPYNKNNVFGRAPRSVWESMIRSDLTFVYGKSISPARFPPPRPTNGLSFRTYEQPLTIFTKI